jgi:hypothetical protein
VKAVHVVVLLLEVLLEDCVDARLEDEGVVEGQHAQIVLAVPTLLAAARHRGVHDVVGHQQVCLKL